MKMYFLILICNKINTIYLAKSAHYQIHNIKIFFFSVNSHLANKDIHMHFIVLIELNFVV